MRRFSVLALIALAGCSNAVTRFEVTSGVNLATSGGFEGGREVVNITVRTEWGANRRLHCEARDTSHIGRGKPFNDKPEDFIHFVGCGVAFNVFGRAK